MLPTKKERIATLLLIMVTIITGFQGFIPSIPGVNQHTQTLLSAIALYLVSALTTWRQFISQEIANNAVKATLVVAIVATVGGLNDIFNIIHFSEVADQWIRFGITFITFMLNLLSKILWPTPITGRTSNP